MPAASQQELEQAALQSLLDSGFFQRAPSLRRILTYICHQYFEGKAEQIKEYNIAVEALGKPSQFDQKTSSVVRVEVHRLRKRLQQYYVTVGASSAVEISIPEGSYVPVFAPRQALIGPVREPIATTNMIGPVLRQHGARGRRLVVGLICAGLAVAALGLWLLAGRSWQTPAPQATTHVDSPAASSQPQSTVRILAGRPPGIYSDRFGRAWSGDQFYTGGSAVKTAYAPISRATDQILYYTMREGGIFRYDIPLQPGSYEMRLYFAETIFGPGNPGSGGETYRIFHVRANGERLLRDFDVIADAPGANVEDVRVFAGISPAADGMLHLELTSTGRTAFLNAIEIKPGLRAGMHPVRFVASDDVYYEPNGAVWYPDWVVTGGIFAARAWAQRGDPRNAIHRSERFGNFTYTIPVAAGRYTVALHFAEAWFGPDLPGGGGAGRRLFDVHCNGQALLQGFDIFRQAGGSMKPLVREFRGIRPNAQGKIVLSFVPVVNYAAINAVEILAQAE